MLRLSLASGMSGPGRLHDLFINMEAMSPGDSRPLHRVSRFATA